MEWIKLIKNKIFIFFNKISTGANNFLLFITPIVKKNLKKEHLTNCITALKGRCIGFFWWFVYNFDYLIGRTTYKLKFYLVEAVCTVIIEVWSFIDSYYRNNVDKIENFIKVFKQFYSDASIFFKKLFDEKLWIVYVITTILTFFIIIYLFGDKDINFTAAILSDLQYMLGIINTLLLSSFSLVSIMFWLIIVGFYINPRYFSIPGLTPRVTAFAISLFIFVLTLLRVFTYDFNVTFYTASDVFVGADIYESFPSLFFVFDPLSLSFGLLVSFIFPIIILTSWEKVHYKSNFFYLNVILLELCVLGAFYTLDLFLFFVFFEAMLVPMSLIILLWGSRQRKLKATSYIFLYTLLGSVFFLAGVIYLYTVFDTTNYFYILKNVHSLPSKAIYFLWFAFFLPFAIKIPMFPFHIWLPEAHVEAPTAGSIALAAILLKLGGYGFIRFLIPLFHEPSVFFSPLVSGLALVGVIYASLSAFRQTDIKKIIAYSSIAHMNIVVLGIFSFNVNGYYGAITLMIGHGLVSSALFFLAGVLYDRYHTRSLFYYGGLAQVMPLFSNFLFFFIVANFGFPCSVSFIGEFFIFLGVFKSYGLLVSLIIGFSSVMAVYLNMLLFISICFGSLSNNINNVYQDLSYREIKILLCLLIVSLLFFLFHGVYFTLISNTSMIFFHLFI